MKYFVKNIILVSILLIPVLGWASGVSNIDSSMAIERVVVSSDGKLHVWDKEGNVVFGWPKDLSSENRVFSFGSRLVDVDLDLQAEIVAVSEDKSNGSLKMHLYKGNTAELTNWGFNIPHGNITATPLIADINKDSSPEIIYATEDSRVYVYRRDFQAISNFEKSFSAKPYLVAGDLDNDGLDNLYAASGDKIYTWDESGNLTDFFSLSGGEEVINKPTIIDINKDNYPEILFSTTANRIVGLNKDGDLVLEIGMLEGVNIVSPLIVEDIDVDKEPEFIILTDKEDVLAFESTGETVASWSYSLDYREPVSIGGVVANDLYRGLFSSVTGWDQNVLYRTKYNTYSRIKLGENVRDWDAYANFDFIEMVKIEEVFVFPKLFTPNGDGVNDITKIHYRLSDDALVALDLYDAHGRFISRIREKESRTSGEHQETWTGVNNQGTVTENDDVPLASGIYLIKIMAESKDGFVSHAEVAAIVNGIKAEIEVPTDDNEDDGIYPKVFGSVTVSGIATDPNFGEDNLDADFHSYKLYYRPGVWDMTDADIVLVGQMGSSWAPLAVPLRHQCSDGSYLEPNDTAYPSSNVSCRPVQHGVLGTFDASDLGQVPNGEYTLLLKVMDSNRNMVGKVNYDTLVVTVANPNPNDPYDPGNPYDINNPDNPLYQGPEISNVNLSNVSITRQSASTTISYALQNETSNVHITIFPDSGAGLGTPVSIYSFNNLAPNDPGNPTYSFVWNGTNTLGRNVSGGTYRIRITANAIDGTGVDTDDSLTVNVAKGFAASDTLGIATDPDTGESKFTVTPSHFNPFGFGPTMEPEKAHIDYELTKEARVTIQVLEDVPLFGLLVRKTLSSGIIKKQDNGNEYWDGTGDNGLILPVGKDYIIRLIAEGIDIGNEETIYADRIVHLDAGSLNGSLVSDITQLQGDDVELIGDSDPLSTMVGNPDFLWRAKGSGFVQIPFNYTISASGYEYNYVEEHKTATEMSIVCAGADISGGPGGGGFDPNMWVPFDMSINMSSGYSIYSFGIGIDRPATVSVQNNSFNQGVESFDIPPIKEYSLGSNGTFDTKTLKDNSAVNFTAACAVPPVSEMQATQCVEMHPADPATSADWWTVCHRCHDSNGVNLCDGWNLGLPSYYGIFNCGYVTAYAYGTKPEIHYWGPDPGSGNRQYTITSTGTNPDNDFASYDGTPGTGGDSPEITSYSLTVSNQINGVSSSGSSGTPGEAITLPGLQAEFNSSGQISAEIHHNGGLLTTYNTDQHDTYLDSAPYKKIWGRYENFNDDYFRRTTNNINIFNGYQQNIFNGNPGTNLYSFSNVVHLTSWDVEIRYPNITVSKPDGDNALNVGTDHTDVFEIYQTHVTAPGVSGNRNSNINDFFNLRLLPEAVPKLFVEIRGSAGANYELYYYDSSDADLKWHAIEPRTTNPVTDDILAHWDVTGLNGNRYTVVLKVQNGDDVNIDKFDIGIGELIDTANLGPDEVAKACTPFKRSCLLFGEDTLTYGSELVTITPVDKSEAEFILPSGVAPLGPIFDVKPDDIAIDPAHHVQLEIIYTPSELQGAFGVSDATELTIYNLAGNEVIEGLATIITFDDMDDADPNNDVWRFTANLEHFSQYFLAKKIAGYFHIEAPESDEYLKGSVTVIGRVEDGPRPEDQPDVPKDLALLTSVTANYYEVTDPGTLTEIYSASDAVPTIDIASINFDWDVSSLNGNYVLKFEAEGPAGAKTAFEVPVAIDNEASQSMLLINGKAITDGSSVKAATGSVIEIKSTDSSANEWQTGVESIEFSFDGGAYEQYEQPFNLYFLSGEHTIDYRAIDKNGNIEADKSATINVEEKMSDDQAADLALDLVINGPTYNFNEQIWVNGDAEMSIVAVSGDYNRIMYRIGGSEYVAFDQPFNIGENQEGPYVVEYFALDDLDLRSDIQRESLILDSTAPVSEMEIQGLHQKTPTELIVTPGTSLMLKAFDGDESQSGLDRIEYRIGSGNWQIYNDPVTFADSSALAYRAVDKVGNVEDEHLINVRIDDVIPTLSISSAPSVISPNGDGRHDTLDLVVSAVDNVYEDLVLNMTLTSGGDVYQIFDNVPLEDGENKLTWDGLIDGQLLPEDIYDYEITIIDGGGNTSESSTGTLTYDITPPVVNVLNGVVRAFSPNGDDLTDVLQVSYDVSDNLFAQDLAIELGILSQDDFEMLKTTDTVSIPPAEHVISWNGTNALENGLFDGNYEFQIVAEDPAGNRSDPKDGSADASGEVFVDRWAPDTILSVSGPSFDDEDLLWIGNGASFVLESTDPVPASGVDKMFYSFNGGAQQEYLQPFGLPQEAVDYELGYSSTDMVGNPEDENKRNVRLDQTPPVTDITIGSPQETDNGELYVSPLTPVTLDFEDVDGVGVKEAYIEIEGVRDPGRYDEAVTLAGLGDGYYNLLYWSEDELENIETKKNEEVMLDGTAPVTKILVNGPQYLDKENEIIYVTSATSISFEAETDRDDLDRIEYKVDDYDWQIAQNFNFDNEGTFDVSYRSFDRLENQEKDQLQKFVVDNSGPEPSLTLSQNATGGINYITPTTQITLSGTDNASNIASITYRIDDGELITYSSPFNLSGYGPGTHVITYFITDRLGNVSKETKYVAQLLDVTVERTEFTVPRILVFMLQTHDLRPEDPRPNSDLLKAVKSELGAYMTVIDGDQNDPAVVEKFVTEMRTDKYTTFVLATDSYAVNFYDNTKVVNMFKELSSRIYKGDALVLALGYSSISGQSWFDFVANFSAVDSDLSDLFVGMGDQVSLITRKYGKGVVADFGADIGRLALEGSNYPVVQLGLVDTIRKIMPLEDENNAGEVTDYTITYQNYGDQSVIVHTSEVFPDGWIETAATSGAFETDSREYDLTVPADGSVMVDYLYRSKASIGEHEISAVVKSKWSNGLESESALVSPYIIENDVIGLIDKLIGYNGLIEENTMSGVVERMDMVRKRLLLDSGGINTDADIDQLISYVLESFDLVDSKNEQIKSVLCEIVESLGVLQSVKFLDLNLSISTGNPDDPTSFHGETASYLGSGKGGCSLVREVNDNLLSKILLLLTFIVFLYMLKKKRNGQSSNSKS